MSEKEIEMRLMAFELAMGQILWLGQELIKDGESTGSDPQEFILYIIQGLKAIRMKHGMKFQDDQQMMN